LWLLLWPGGGGGRIGAAYNRIQQETAMLYVIAIIFPPLALLMANRLGHAILNFVMVCVSIPLMIIGVGFLIHVLPVVHACVVIGGKNADKRTDRIVQAMRKE